MLAYFLAIAIAVASLYLYLSAFIARDIHRQDDFLWSGVGLFYALILWICAGQVRGSILLGQGAAVALVLSFGWQTIRLRRAIAHPEEATDKEGFSVMAWLKGRFSGKKGDPTPPQAESPTETQEKDQAETPTPIVASTPTVEQTVVEEEAMTVTDAVIEEITEIQEASTPIATSTPTDEETVVKEEATPVTEETLEEDPLNDILEDLEGESDDQTPSKASEITLEENSFDFEPYIADNEAETVIEAYTPPTITPIVTETDNKKKESETVDTKEDKELMDELDEFMEEIEKEDKEKS